MIEAARFIDQNFAVIHYLDDFFAAGSPGVNPTAYGTRFDDICTYIGIKIKGSKSVTGTIADFNGIGFDAVAMEDRLPQPKLVKARNLVASLIQRKQVTLHELRSVTD